MFSGVRHNSNHVKCAQITFKADLFLISQLRKQKSAVLYLIPSVSIEKYTILEVGLCDVTKGALMGLPPHTPHANLFVKNIPLN